MNSPPDTFKLWSFTINTPGFKPKIAEFQRSNPIDLYMGCNLALGPHAETNTGAGELVVTMTGHHGVAYDTSYLKKTIALNEEWTRPGYFNEECDLVLKLTAVTAEYCEFEFTGCYDGMPTKPPIPTPAPVVTTASPVYVPPAVSVLKRPDTV